jgi:hypothetical protein
VELLLTNPEINAPILYKWIWSSGFQDFFEILNDLAGASLETQFSHLILCP